MRMKALLQITMETYTVSDTDIQPNELCLNNANNRKTTYFHYMTYTMNIMVSMQPERY